MDANQWHERWEWITFSLGELRRECAISQTVHGYHTLVLEFSYEPSSYWTLAKVSVAMKEYSRSVSKV